MLPQSLTARVKRLSRYQLYELAALVAALLAELDTPPDPPERPDRDVIRRKAIGSVTYQLERVRCGKACRGCPHGPYWYAYFRNAGRLVSKYIGKELDTRKVKL